MANAAGTELYFPHPNPLPQAGEGTDQANIGQRLPLPWERAGVRASGRTSVLQRRLDHVRVRRGWSANQFAQRMAIIEQTAFFGTGI